MNAEQNALKDLNKDIPYVKGLKIANQKPQTWILPGLAILFKLNIKIKTKKNFILKIKFFFIVFLKVKTKNLFLLCRLLLK